MSNNTNFAQNRIAKEPYWVEYLENVNVGTNTSIVDTGIPIGDIGAVHCTFSLTEALSTSTPSGFGTTDMFFFGGCKTNNAELSAYTYMSAVSGTDIKFGSSVTNKVYSLYALSSKSGNSITNSIYYTKGNGLVDNSTRIAASTHTNSSVDLTTTFSLFKCKNSNTYTTFFCRIYSCHIFDHEGNVISWLRPCLHPQTLKPAFYDIVRRRFLYLDGAADEITYGHTFIPAHYIRLNNAAVPEFKLWGLDANSTVTQYSVSPNPRATRLDMAVKFKQGQNKPIIQYPSQVSNSMVIRGNVGSDNNTVTLTLLQSNGGDTAPDSFINNSVGNMSDLIVHNDLSSSICYFIDNGLSHTALGSFLIDYTDGGYPIIGGTQSMMDIGGFSMRYTTPNTSISGIQPFGFYYDFQPCRIIADGTNYGRSAFFDYVNAQYIIGASESTMSASEGICTLTVNDTASTPSVQAVAWQYNVP